MGGFYRILWGFFLKLMIADRAALYVDWVYDLDYEYVGCYVLMAGILYSIELYADFSACISISKGVANLFGIELADNFRHPYLAVSVQDFWHRWHISLSEWLKDYIYIPLGGSRKGTAVIDFLGQRHMAWRGPAVCGMGDDACRLSDHRAADTEFTEKSGEAGRP